MGTDRNTIIGYVLLGILLLTYIYLSTKNSQELARQKKIYDDSVAIVKNHHDSLSKLADTAHIQVSAKTDTNGASAISKVERLTTIENDVLRIVFSNKGAQPKEVELKKFNSYDSTPVKLMDSTGDTKISYTINASSDQSAQIENLL